jgi:hypothetical protein
MSGCANIRLMIKSCRLQIITLQIITFNIIYYLLLIRLFRLPQIVLSSTKVVLFLDAEKHEMSMY